MHGASLNIVLILLLAAILVVPLFKRFGLGGVLGYLVTGILLGPHALRVVNDPDGVLAASEIGIVMMLFVIGLELSLPRLKVMRRPIFGAGGLQMGLSMLLLSAFVYFQDIPWITAVFVAGALALSSTAVGLQLLAERKTLGTEHGRLAFAILLFQDIAAIPMLAAIPLLGHSASAQAHLPWWVAVLKVAGAIALLVVGGRALLRPIFRAVARTHMPEVFAAAALFVVLGSAWLMEAVGLSAGLGAFLAGVLLTDSEYRHELEGQIKPFEGLLLGLFFIAVGMSINVDQILSHPAQIFAGVVALLLAKGVVLYGVGRHVGHLTHVAAGKLAVTLALGGEFAFVLFNEMSKYKLLTGELQETLVAVVGVSMALTPLLVLLMERLAKNSTPPFEVRPHDPVEDTHPRVMVVGFGRFGQVVGRVLMSRNIPFVAFEHDVEQVEFVRRFGNKVYYGDILNTETLRAAGAEGVSVFVLTLNDPDMTLLQVEMLRRQFPKAKIIARASDRRNAWHIKDRGAVPVRELFSASLDTATQVMQMLGVPENEAKAHSAKFRVHDEALLEAQRLVQDDEAALKQTAQEARIELEQLFNADEEQKPQLSKPDRPEMETT
ncbi:glutathione-regulated potassium-efflux system protein KefB [Lysobacter sp. HDW10]|uniref:monovalent cation:proton antiporter-2 (CPA2) family protein n=1 Tax=Lysobacter sp. HDW10 TaxID=2714936 RepID=UPI001409DA34|nr:monovalent cation:proton antiporter-2 (CPA2) family protein [Lysobacter sp. HDW10]QIK80969.1 glutathione-regulated potassium-efflux system protein KefB [Lysobacter sp. HDW10]